MKRLLYIAIFAFATLIWPCTSVAQSTGEWVPCLDPGGSGQMVSCFVPYSSPQQSGPTVMNNVSQQVVVVVNQPAAEQPRYDNRRQRSHPAQVSQAPYWETQQRTTSRRTYGGGLDRWTGRPYGHVEYQTETISVKAEANSLVFRPTISINSSYWPSYRNW